MGKIGIMERGELILKYGKMKYFIIGAGPAGISTALYAGQSSDLVINNGIGAGKSRKMKLLWYGTSLFPGRYLRQDLLEKEPCSRRADPGGWSAEDWRV